MWTYVARRLLLLIPVILGVSMLTFLIMRAAGDPVTAYLSNPERASQQQIDAIIHRYHLDEPIYVQYFYWLNGVAHGDLGYSQVTKEPVATALMTRFAATFELATISTIIAVFVGIRTGTKAAVRANSAYDQGVRVTSLVAVSIPVFWLGLILLMIFYRGLGWLPGPERISTTSSLPAHTVTGFYLIDSLLRGSISDRLSLFWDVVKHLIMPSITLAFASTAIIIRMMRSSMLEVLGAEYVRTARSKGVPEDVVIQKHARRNALIPTTTVVGLTFGGLLGGAVLTETVFNWNGLGWWSGRAALNLDTAAIMGFTLLTAIIYVLSNLCVDIAYAYLDPRVRLG